MEGEGCGTGALLMGGVRLEVGSYVGCQTDRRIRRAPMGVLGEIRAWIRRLRRAVGYRGHLQRKRVAMENRDTHRD